MGGLEDAEVGGTVGKTNGLEPHVAKNSLVTVHLVTANMTLTVQGRAMEDGSMGEAIRVMNTKSNSVITAVVRGPGEVEVVTASLASAN